MYIPEEKLQKIQNFIKSAYTVNSEQEFLQNLLPEISRIIPSEFYGIVLYPNRIKKDILFQTNNTAEFINAYSNGLAPHDVFTDYMIRNGNAVTVLHKFMTEEKRRSDFFLNECDRIRPAGDGCYIPLIFEGSLLGFYAVGREQLHKEIYSDNDVSLLVFLTQFLSDGLTRALKPNFQDTNTALINAYGQVVDAGEQARICFQELFGTQHWNCPGKKGDRNSLYFAEFLDNFLFREAGFERAVCRLSSQGHINNLVFRYLPTDKYRLYLASEPQVSVTIERSRKESNIPDILRINEIRKSYSLTTREAEMVRLIYRGYSNSEISSLLKIQESTVKRHIYNLFNKVGADSRTQLIFLLMQ